MLRKCLPSILVASLVASLAAACGGAEPPPPPPPPPPAATAAPPPEPTPPPPPPEPTPEEKKKAEAAKKLQEDRDKWDAENKAELARWTPEMHAAAQALADKAYPTGKAAIAAAVKGTHRMPGHADRDKYRHPVETLEFFGFKPTMTVLDVSPGEGWYTELLAPALAKKGQYFATTSDPNGPADARSTFYGQQFKGFLDHSPEAYGKVQTIVVDPKAPSLGKDGTFDIIFMFRELHGMKNNGTLDAWLAEALKALKPGGVLAIEEHRAKADADPVQSSKKGYLPEKWVIDTITAAGFKFGGKSEVNANPKDTKDYDKGVWVLPPTLELGATDREKYVAIGESDRMTLKFIKPAAKPAPPAAKAAPKSK
jgi:predicted methyltransferase